MTVPKYYEMHKPFLEALQDGQEHTLKEIKPIVMAYFNLAEEDVKELLPSGRQSIFENRIGWARTYLKKAELIDSPKRATFVITEEGKNVLAENPNVIDNKYLMKYEKFREFQNIEKSSESTSPSDESTPDDLFEKSFSEINANLIDEILSEVIKMSPIAFERMVIDLLAVMGYGAFENAGKTTVKTGDEGIDGIIMEDKLGFSLIYIQAKKWDLDRTVGRPEIQNFVGAIAGKGGNGLFVTTAKYSKQAIEYANHQHVILIDGNKLARLMIEYDFGVSTKKVFKIKALDMDLFNEYD